MPSNLEIIPINLPLPLNISDVHAYLLKNDDGFFLIDTGFTNSRRRLERELESNGCSPGKLKLIILTHGDFDHTANAVYLRQRFGVKVAMHHADAGMLENGDMFWNRKFDNRLVKRLMRLLLHYKSSNRGSPDLLLEDGASLSGYGLDASVVNTPGHSAGSVCILTPTGDLFCGDLFINSSGKPMLNSMLYNQQAGLASLEKLKALPIRMIYPGHGAPFKWEELSPE